MKLLLPTACEDTPRLPEGVRAVRYDGGEPVPPEHEDAQVLVAWGNSNAVLADAAARLRDLRLVQSLAAGPDQVLTAGFAPQVALCGGVGLHNAPVAEHALALLLALVRELPEAAQAQGRREWSAALGGARALHPAGRLTTLLGARVLIWGFGSIGQTLAPLVAGLGAHVTGVARTAGHRAGFTVIAQDAVDAALPQTDALVMILPGGPTTAGALSADRIAALPPHALVVNVGRGTTHDEGALVEALRAGRLGGVGLDVTEQEPLPADSPVWDAPRMILTPHAAGGRLVGAGELIGDNVRRLLAGEPLRNVIER